MLCALVQCCNINIDTVGPRIHRFTIHGFSYPRLRFSFFSRISAKKRIRDLQIFGQKNTLIHLCEGRYQCFYTQNWWSFAENQLKQIRDLPIFSKRTSIIIKKKKLQRCFNVFNNSYTLIQRFCGNQCFLIENQKKKSSTGSLGT